MEEQSQTMCRMKKITTLLIDEKADQRIQFYLSLDLLKNSRACVCHDNGFDALAYLKQHPDFIPDYIFFNGELPANQGTLFIKNIRKLKRLQSTTVILLSKENVLPEDLRQAGFAACLPKQRDIHQLKDALKVIFAATYPAVMPVAVEEPYHLLHNIAARIKEMIQSSQVLLEAPHRLSA
jgi:CheY-like chemotaxis protein